MIHFALLISRQGKTRMKKFFSPVSEKEQLSMIKDIRNLVLSRPPKLCNFLEWREYKICYKRYASLYFIFAVDPEDNELLVLEVIHHFVECLDRYFGNVCELDLIFNFHKAYYIFDELFINGELQETSKKQVLRLIAEQDAMMEDKKDQKKQTSVFGIR
ncbi:unnamed protein product [Amoebophrya sp. A120]|nr:unnamed protein product [Amoebophrya sp. A120]|eukprot:GSA120T00007989001.1